jgi:AraC-like DNA-binding protein
VRSTRKDDGRRRPVAQADPFGDVRVGPLMPIPLLLAERGIDPAAVLERTGLPAQLFDDPENRVSFATLGKLLEVCVEVTGCAHFGLLIGQRFRMEALGVLGQLLRNAPTVRDALRMATLHLQIHDRGAVSLSMDVGHGQTALGYALFAGETPAAAQILDGAIAMQYLLLRDLCGRSWTPRMIQLSHSPPAKPAPLQQFFGARIEFDAPLSAVVFESRWLDHPIDGADPEAFAAITRALEAAPSPLMSSFAAQVRRSLHAMIFAGAASTANIARLFDLHERTLRRRLREEGATVRGMVSEVRRELAHHLLRDTGLPVTEVAAILRYSDVTVFSRAFRGWSSASPHEWRARQRLFR